MTRVVDVTALYKEQLRIAENVLAFLASVSLALLKNEDRGKTGLDLEKYWRGGISPGDWRDVLGKCSKVFAGYRDVPLATAIYKLKILSENKGFGKDVIELIRAKNDYKHDRVPRPQKTYRAPRTRCRKSCDAAWRRCLSSPITRCELPVSATHESTACSWTWAATSGSRSTRLSCP